MRPTISLLLCVLLLSACTFSIAAPPPTPTPPPQEFAELLYRALSLEAMTKDAFLMGANGLEDGTLDGTDSMSMALLTIVFMQATLDALSHDYPPIFQTHLDVGNRQYESLRDIGTRWLQDGTLITADVPAELATIDANKSLQEYAEWLIDHGYSYDDVEMMDVRLRDDMQAMAAP